MLADFAHFPRWNRGNIERVIIYEGFENYARAHAQGKGVLILTAHFGNWELLAYAHGLLGHPITLVHRPMHNPLFDRAIAAIRTASGTRVIKKKAAAKDEIHCTAGPTACLGPQDDTAGFEEWGVGAPTGIVRGGGGSSVPEPATIVLFGSALLGLAIWLRKRLVR